MSADQYRQTQSPDSKTKKARDDECHVKRQMTSHWDLDYLSREELEEEMAKGVGAAADEPSTSHEDEPTPDENPIRSGAILLGIALGMMVLAVVLLRL